MLSIHKDLFIEITIEQNGYYTLKRVKIDDKKAVSS